MARTVPQGHYSAYLLRLWRAKNGSNLDCRASIENAHSHERVVFGTLEDLLDYLLARVGSEHEGAREPAVRSGTRSPPRAASRSQEGG